MSNFADIQLCPKWMALLAFINSHCSRNVIIDLRYNYGGDFFVGLKLAQLLVLTDAIDWKTGVYVLIDNVTFSAAMRNAAQFPQLLNAQLVGEPAGAATKIWGSLSCPALSLKLLIPSVCIILTKDDKDALYPDILIEHSISDYIENNDRQLEWILNDIAGRKTAYNAALQGASR
ncbi:S41 family peptidase [Teredinibacter purpureus]|uniref:hypothetical protein n=1 Tax=Teredinibacter purpureus TaxID=2731756 RepID=UPI0013C4E786|nr:hypothetical protein [Teredinibacter purpureus]